MDRDNIIVHLKIWYLQRHRRRCWNKIWHFKFWIRVTGLLKDELGGEIMKDFVGLRAKTYSYLKDNIDEGKKKQKRTKKCVIKRRLKFQDYKNCLEAAQIENKVNHLKRITLI